MVAQLFFYLVSYPRLLSRRPAAQLKEIRYASRMQINHYFQSSQARVALNQIDICMCRYNESEIYILYCIVGCKSIINQIEKSFANASNAIYIHPLSLSLYLTLFSCDPFPLSYANCVKLLEPKKGYYYYNTHSAENDNNIIKVNSASHLHTLMSEQPNISLPISTNLCLPAKLTHCQTHSLIYPVAEGIRYRY